MLELIIIPKAESDEPKLSERLVDALCRLLEEEK